MVEVSKGVRGVSNGGMSVMGFSSKEFQEIGKSSSRGIVNCIGIGSPNLYCVCIASMEWQGRAIES